MPVVVVAAGVERLRRQRLVVERRVHEVVRVVAGVRAVRAEVGRSARNGAERVQELVGSDRGGGDAGAGLDESVLLVTVTGTFLSGGATSLQAVLQHSTDNAVWNALRQGKRS